MYLRFVTDHQHYYSLLREGIFSAAYRIRRSGHSNLYLQDALDDILDWYGDYLKVPVCLKRRTRFGACSKSLSWFKDSAGLPLERAWELAFLVEDHGVRVSVIKTRHPGQIIYQDRHQIVANAEKGGPA